MSDRARRVVALLLAVGITAVILVFRDDIARLAAYGYPGIFLITLLSSATVILPVPGLALVFAAGASFNPLLVGIAAGIGAGLGEITGYLVGYGGRGTVENRGGYARVRRWMERYGVWVIFAMSAVPNPVFDVAGITAGIMRIPVWLFLLAACAGNVLKATVVAFAGAGTAMLLGPALQKWFGR
jgi:membrane protein YqaA with SNARE-associated domain